MAAEAAWRFGRFRGERVGCFALRFRCFRGGGGRGDAGVDAGGDAREWRGRFKAPWARRCARSATLA